MRIYGYARKRLNVISFMLGVVIVAFIWIYVSNFIVVGKVNGVPIYTWQINEYQRAERAEIKNRLFDDILQEQYNESERSESFEDFKSKASISDYGI